MGRQVPEKKLKLVMADKELYRACAVEVKRQIWQDNQALFGDEVSPLLKQYILEKEGALFSTELSVLHNFFSPSPKARRQGEVRPGGHRRVLGGATPLAASRAGLPHCAQAGLLGFLSSVPCRRASSPAELGVLLQLRKLLLSLHPANVSSVSASAIGAGQRPCSSGCLRGALRSRRAGTTRWTSRVGHRELDLRTRAVEAARPGPVGQGCGCGAGGLSHQQGHGA